LAGAALADGVYEALYSLLAADVPFSAATAEVDVAEAAASAVSADVLGVLSDRQLLSPGLTVCQLPCESVLRPVSPADADEPAERPFDLPMVSAGSGTAVLGPAFGLSSVAASSASAVSADVAASAEVAASTESIEVSVSPEEEEFPLLPPDGRDTAERERSVLVRDDDMMPLSTIVSEASPSGSTFRPGGAMMSGG
jgi:hypothetical protein